MKLAPLDSGHEREVTAAAAEVVFVTFADVVCTIFATLVALLAVDFVVVFVLVLVLVVVLEDFVVTAANT